ncbi:hypothetical protein EMCRGX_G029477 [Ephydatia muelleri]
MAFLRKLLQSSAKKTKEYPNIRKETDPLEQWNKIGELGDGAFGKVYKAQHRESGKLAALKRVPIIEESELEDFMVEIDILAECKHANIVQLYEAFLFDNALWIFIEFCPGGAMDNIILELEHGLLEPQIKCACKQLFEALVFLHQHDCIHRDLKAGNILLCPDGSIRLADFGVSAKGMKVQNGRDTYIGTPYWMAPEVVVCETNKDAPYNTKADVWSAGITLIELAEMNPPYHEMSPMRVLLKITKSLPPTLSQPNMWSKDFSSFLGKCLVYDPTSRSLAKDMLQHPFISSVQDNQPLRALYGEVRADVVEVVEEVPSNQVIPLSQDVSFTVSDKDDSKLIGSLSTPTKDLADPFAADPETSISSVSSVRGNDGFQYATLSRVRKFEVDGKFVQTKISHIVDVTGHMTLRDNKRYQQIKKQDLHEMRQMQRVEMKEATEFFVKMKATREQNEKSFGEKMEAMNTKFDSEIEQLGKRQKKEMERLAQSQEQQYKMRVKELKAEQALEQKHHREQMKEAEKAALREVEKSVPKPERKRSMTQTKSDWTVKKTREESDLTEKQLNTYNQEMRNLVASQREDMKALELKFLEENHNIQRSRENERFLQENQKRQEEYQLTKQHTKQAFHMQRHQMNSRQEKEKEQQAKKDQFKMEDLKQRQLLEERQLPKVLKEEQKAKIAEAKKMMKGKKDVEKLRQANDEYVQKSRREVDLMMERHRKALETLEIELETNMRELGALQNQRKVALTEQENAKLKQKDEDYNQELKAWKAEVARLKHDLEEELRREREHLEQSYAAEDFVLPHHQRMNSKSAISLSHSISSTSGAKEEMEEQGDVTVVVDS